MRKRNTAILAASLAAHAALLMAWMSTRPDLRIAEPATLQVELLRPTRQPHPRPRPIRSPRVASTAPEAQPTTPPSTAPPAPPPPALPAPKSIDPRLLTDQELLSKAGPRPDIRRLHAQEALRPVFSRRLGIGPDESWTSGCKPSWETSNRAAPPCASDSAEERAAKWKAANDSKTQAFEGEGAYKRAMKSYQEAPGAAGYPGIKCAILHRC